MPYNEILPPVEGESVDTPKKFTNIDKEDFEFTWQEIKTIVKAGETVSLPKYKVNFASTQLARKIVKRELIVAHKKANPTEIMERAIFPLRDEAKEFEYQKKIVEVNFPKEIEKEKEEEIPLYISKKDREKEEEKKKEEEK